jgi:hypothetical protein
VIAFDDDFLRRENRASLVFYLRTGGELTPALREFLINELEKPSRGPKVPDWVARATVNEYKRELKEMAKGGTPPAPSNWNIDLVARLKKLKLLDIDSTGQRTKAARALACKDLNLSPAQLDVLIRIKKRVK